MSTPQRREPLVFPKFVDGKVSDLSQFESPSLLAIGKNTLSRIPSGDCILGPGETTTDASVSAYNLNASLCFSIGNLARIPPTDLLRQVLALVLHEAVHLGGGSEDEAREWQRQFAEYFGIRFGDISKGSIEEQTIKAFSDAKGALETAISIASKNTDDPQIYTHVGRFNATIASLPDVFDPLALQIKLKPAHPELIDNYSNSVLALIEKVHIRFEMPFDFITVRGISSVRKIRLQSLSNSSQPPKTEPRRFLSS